MSAKKSTSTKAAAAGASSIAEFKRRKKGGVLPLPSGLVIVARKVQLRTFLEQGDVPNPLLEVIEEALNKGRDMDVTEMIAAEGKGINLDMVNDMYTMVDKVVMAVCVEPEVHPVPEDEADRDDDLLYIDEFDDEDKMFLFQWSQGGTSDLATFRREATADLVSLAQIQGSAGSTESGTGA